MKIVLILLLAVAPVAAQRGHGGHGGVGPAGGRVPGTSAAPRPRAAHPETRLAQNPALSSRLQGLLPAGSNVQTAAQGFKNLGQFAAAAHVSRNLGIPFDQLKAKTTGPNAESLGNAIHDLRPDLDHKTIKGNVKAAEKQAKEDLKQEDFKARTSESVAPSHLR